MKTHRNNVLKAPADTEKFTNLDNRAILESFLNAKNQNRDILFRLIDILIDRLNVLEDAFNTFKTSANQIQEVSIKKQVPDLLTCKEACELLKMCPHTLNQKRKEGKIKAYKLGKGFVYEWADLLKLGQLPKNK